jgi:hypothetical protein
LDFSKLAGQFEDKLEPSIMIINLASLYTVEQNHVGLTVYFCNF